jgi:hypothetical protein
MPMRLGRTLTLIEQLRQLPLAVKESGQTR